MDSLFHTIISSNFKFILRYWERSIENSGGFPIIKYTAKFPPGTTGNSEIFWIQITKNSISEGTAAVTMSDSCKPGAEILLIGDTIHFSEEILILGHTPFANPNPGGYPTP